MDLYTAGYKEAMHFLAKLYHEDSYNHGVTAVAKLHLLPSCQETIGRYFVKIQPFHRW